MRCVSSDTLLCSRVILIFGLLELLFFACSIGLVEKAPGPTLGWLASRSSGSRSSLIWGRIRSISRRNWLSYPASVLLGWLRFHSRGRPDGLGCHSRIAQLGLSIILSTVSAASTTETAAEPIDNQAAGLSQGTAAGIPVLSLGWQVVWRPLSRLSGCIASDDVDSLPGDLEGLAHPPCVRHPLRHYVTLDTVEQVVASARPHAPTWF